MTLQLATPHPDRKSRPRVHLLAVILVVLPAYVLPIALTLGSQPPPPLKTIYLYYTALAAVMILAIASLQRYLFGQRLGDLNMKPGAWWRDIVMGVALLVVTLGTTLVLQGPLLERFPQKSTPAIDAFFREFVSSPQLFIIMMGPVLIISAAVFEELTRAFVLNHMWQFNRSAFWRWLAICLSATLFGLAHLYQGPAGVINAGLGGMLLAIYYAHFGRVAPMMISHYLYDAIQFGAVYLFANLS